MGRGGGSQWGARPPSSTPYFIAVGGVVILLALLFLYCLYFCFSRVKELSAQELVSQCPAKATTSYPVQPGVREGAQAMAQMCRQLPIPACDTDVASPSTHDSSVASHITNDVNVSSQSHSTQESSIERVVVNDATVASTSQTQSASQATDCQAISLEIIDDVSVASPIRSVNVLSPGHDANPASSSSEDASRDSGIATRSSLRNSFLFHTDRVQDSLTSITSCTNDNSSSLAVCKSLNEANIASHSDDTTASSQLHDASFSPQTNDASVTSQASYDASVSSQTLDDAALSYDLSASKLTAPAAITTVNKIGSR